MQHQQKWIARTKLSLLKYISSVYIFVLFVHTLKMAWTWQTNERGEWNERRRRKNNTHTQIEWKQFFTLFFSLHRKLTEMKCTTLWTITSNRLLCRSFLFFFYILHLFTLEIAINIERGMESKLNFDTH